MQETFSLFGNGLTYISIMAYSRDLHQLIDFLLRIRDLWTDEHVNCSQSDPSFKPAESPTKIL
jgi:hypothetical protein